MLTKILQFPDKPRNTYFFSEMIRFLYDLFFFFWNDDDTFRERRPRRVDAYEKTTIP